MRVARLVLQTGWLMLTAPARWRVPQWSCSVMVAAAVALACVYRLPLQLQIEGRGGSSCGVVAGIANVAGSGPAVTALGLGALLTGVALRKDEIVSTSLVLAAAGVWAFALFRTGQFVLAEQRPMDGGAMRFFAWGGHGISGHAAATALLVLPVRNVLLRRARPLTRNVAALGLGLWTAVVAWSRVWLGMHFAWNVLAGAALGFCASAAAVAALNGSGCAPSRRRRAPGTPKPHVRVARRRVTG